MNGKDHFQKRMAFSKDIVLENSFIKSYPLKAVAGIINALVVFL